MTVEIDYLVGKVKFSKNEQDRRIAIQKMLTFCLKKLAIRRSETQMQILLEVAFLLRDHPNNDLIWDWLRRVSESADDSLREALTISIFELIPQRPTTLEALKRLWEFQSNAKTEWVTDYAYRNTSKNKKYRDRIKAYKSNVLTIAPHRNKMVK